MPPALPSHPWFRGEPRGDSAESAAGSHLLSVGDRGLGTVHGRKCHVPLRGQRGERCHCLLSRLTDPQSQGPLCYTESWGIRTYGNGLPNPSKSVVKSPPAQEAKWVSDCCLLSWLRGNS